RAAVEDRAVAECLGHLVDGDAPHRFVVEDGPAEGEMAAVARELAGGDVEGADVRQGEEGHFYLAFVEDAEDDIGAAGGGGEIGGVGRAGDGLAAAFVCDAG